VGGLFADSALACSYVNEAAARPNSVAEAGYYWIVSGMIGGVAHRAPGIPCAL
jgi:hypothetical protein